MLEFIPIGKENAIKRSDLCKETGLSDRKMRRKIEALQLEGHRIINLGKGYYIGTDEEFRIYERKEWHRIRSEMAKLRAMKNAENSASTTE